MSPSIPPGLAPAPRTPLQRLASAIRDRQIATAVVRLVELAQAGLRDLEVLDESLYERFKAGGRSVAEETGADLRVRAVMASTFRGLKAFTAYCQGLRPLEPQEGEGGAGDDFSFGDLEGAAAAKAAEPELDLGDIGALLEGIDEHPQQTEAQRFTALREQLSSIEYGLTSQLMEMEDRVKVSLSSWEIAQAIEVLDDTKVSTSQGVFACLSAVCQAFLPDADPTTLAPGHLTVLDEALLVRQELAELGRKLAPPHARLQGDDSSTHQAALADLRAALKSFVEGAAFGIMRPADRWQLTQFERSLREQAPGAAKFTSEGLAKYLESLGSINQREVLILHDQRAAAELGEALAAAQQLALISPRLAVDPAQKAIAAALSLYGSSPEIDEAIAPLREWPPNLEDPGEVAESLAVLERLAQSLHR